MVSYSVLLEIKWVLNTFWSNAQQQLEVDAFHVPFRVAPEFAF